MENLALKDDPTDPAMGDTGVDKSVNGNGIRTGAEYLEGLRDGREVWTRGKHVEDVTVEPGMARGAATMLAQDRPTILPTAYQLTVNDGGLFWIVPGRGTSSEHPRQTSERAVSGAWPVLRPVPSDSRIYKEG